MSGETSPAGDPHPGEIAFEDLVEPRRWTRKAAEVPQTVAWVQVGEEWAPVMRIVSSGTLDRRRIDKLGAHGEMLESTIQAPPPLSGPPAPAPPKLPKK
jgi:hypothetical protein